MTLTLLIVQTSDTRQEFDPDIVKMYHHTANNMLMLIVSKVIARIDTQPNTQTDTQTIQKDDLTRVRGRKIYEHI